MSGERNEHSVTLQPDVFGLLSLRSVHAEAKHCGQEKGIFQRQSTAGMELEGLRVWGMLPAG